MSQLFELNSVFVSIISLYVQTFGVFKLKLALIPSICQSSLQVLSEISAINTLMKQYTEKISSYGSEGKDRLKGFLDKFSRSLSWFVGLTAYKLIRVKEEKESQSSSGGGKKESTPQDKMHDLIIQSNLLSGGIENRFLCLFSQETQEKIEEMAQVSGDKEMVKMMKKGVSKNEEDKVLESIIHSGKEAMVDRLITYLQQMLERKVPMVPYARLSGQDGMRLSRAAFSVMIKFSDYLLDTVSICLDEIDLLSAEYDDAAERDAKIKESLKTIPHFDALLKRWESASKMRVWINEKKTNLMERIKKSVEAEYKKKKEEDKEKKTEEEKKVESDGPVKVEEIEMIDTSSEPKKKEEEKPVEEKTDG